MLPFLRWLFLFSFISYATLQGIDNDSPRFRHGEETAAQGRGLLDWIGLGTGPDTDPYLAKINYACINGDLAECFKSQALGSLNEFFDKPTYTITEHARIFRLPENQLRQLRSEPYEYSDSPRADEPEWDQLLKFVMRRVEKFLKSTAIEVDFNNEITEEGRYSPRFIDEISDEIDQIENKKDSYFKRKQLKKLVIPLLIILKLFKLKLLLFLPLILGLASFKKLLGFLAIIVPGLIGFFHFCKPNLQSSNYFSQYTPAGVGYRPHYKEEPSFALPDYPQYGGGGGSYGNVHFKDDNHAQSLAYKGWGHYRNNGGDIEAETETTTKKSILPDS